MRHTTCNVGNFSVSIFGDNATITVSSTHFRTSIRIKAVVTFLRIKNVFSRSPTLPQDMEKLLEAVNLVAAESASGNNPAPVQHFTSQKNVIDNDEVVFVSERKVNHSVTAGASKPVRVRASTVVRADAAAGASNPGPFHAVTAVRSFVAPVQATAAVRTATVVSGSNRDPVQTATVAPAKSLSRV